MTLKSILIVKDSSLVAHLSKKIKNNSLIESLPLTHKPMEMISRYPSKIDVVFFEVTVDGLVELENILKLSRQFKSIVLIIGNEGHHIKAHDLSDVEFLFHPIRTFQFDLLIERIVQKVPVIIQNKFAITGDFMIKDVVKKEIIRCYYEEITVIEITDKLLKIHTASQNLIESNVPLNRIQKMVEPVGIFFRVHESFIISRAYIKSLMGDSVRMEHYGPPVKIGPHYREKFNEFLNSRIIR